MNMNCLKLGLVILFLATLLGCSDKIDIVTDVHDEYSDLEDRLMILEEDFAMMTSNLQEEINSLKTELVEVNRNNRDLEYELMLTNETIRSFARAWPDVQTFADAYFELDLDTVRRMLSDKYTVHDESISYILESEGEIHIPHSALRGSIDSYHLNSFGYVPTQSVANHFFQFLVMRENNSFFMNLYMRSYGHEWIVELIEFDI